MSIDPATAMMLHMDKAHNGDAYFMRVTLRSGKDTGCAVSRSPL